VETVTDDELRGKEAKGGDLTGHNQAVTDDELRGKEAKGGDLTGHNQAVADDELRGNNGVGWRGQKDGRSRDGRGSLLTMRLGFWQGCQKHVGELYHCF
jgi:hypothetical protein